MFGCFLVLFSFHAKLGTTYSYRIDSSNKVISRDSKDLKLFSKSCPSFENYI